MKSVLILITSLALVNGLAHSSNVKSSHVMDTQASFVRALEFKHSLRVCNAYPYGAALDIALNKEKLTSASGPLPYKNCNDYKNVNLRAGDKIQFSVGDANAGTFAVSDLPSNDAVLLLVIHRHDTLSTAVAFKSHVFANLLNAQVAVIDTYKGSAHASIDVVDPHTKRHEKLNYNSVVAVNKGDYVVRLQGEKDQVVTTGRFVALDRESYVLLRVGVDAQEGPKYSEDLVVFPQSDAVHLNSAISSIVPSIALAFSLVVSMLMM